MGDRTRNMVVLPDAERDVNNLKGSDNFVSKNGSTQGHDLALPGLGVPSSLDSGYRKPW